VHDVAVDQGVEVRADHDDSPGRGDGPSITAAWERRSDSLAYRERNPKVAGSEWPSLACSAWVASAWKDHPAVIDQRALGDGSVRAFSRSTKVNGGGPLALHHALDGVGGGSPRIQTLVAGHVFCGVMTLPAGTRKTVASSGVRAPLAGDEVTEGDAVIVCPIRA